MKLSSRELTLGMMTGLIVLIGLSYWFGKPKIETWKELAANQEALERRIELAKRVIDQKDEWEERLASIRTRLSVYPADRDATADYLRILERVAKANNVNLVRRRARKEKSYGDLYELGIDCTWEAELGALVRFLYALEQEDVTMDIDDLTIALVAGSEGQLRGDFTLICVYTRDDAEPEPPESGDAAGGEPSSDVQP